MSCMRQAQVQVLRWCLEGAGEHGGSPMICWRLLTCCAWWLQNATPHVRRLAWHPWSFSAVKSVPKAQHVERFDQLAVASQILIEGQQSSRSSIFGSSCEAVQYLLAFTLSRDYKKESSNTNQTRKSAGLQKEI